MSKRSEGQLYLINEPGAGLHEKDLNKLIALLKNLCESEHGVIVHAFRKALLLEADVLLNSEDLQSYFDPIIQKSVRKQKDQALNEIVLKGVSTNNLKHIDLVIPKHKITAIIGRSGSGKSSLAFGTIAAECESRYLKNWSPHIQGLLRQNNTADVEQAKGLSACVALRQFESQKNNKSTVETVSGMGLPLRLLFSRLYQLEHNGAEMEASEFSYHRSSSACPNCKGKGEVQVIREEELVADWNVDLDEAFIQNNALNYFTNPHGQFMAVWKKLSEEFGFQNGPLNSWTEEQLNLFWHGSGDRIYECTWKYKNKSRSGEQKIAAPWRGIVTELYQEFSLKKDNKNADALRSLFTSDECPKCNGKRLNERVLSFKHRGHSYYDWSAKDINTLNSFLQNGAQNAAEQELYARCFRYLKPLLNSLIELGLGEVNLKEGKNNLSSGNQRALQLAGASHSSLSGMIFILDEPSWGMNKKQIQALQHMIHTLKDKGNTVLLVEHRRELIASADHLIELGPKGGEEGGRLMYQGEVENHLNLVQNSQHNRSEGLTTIQNGTDQVLASFEDIQFEAPLPNSLRVRASQLDFLYLEDERQRKRFLSKVMKEGLTLGRSPFAKIEGRIDLSKVAFLEQNRPRPNTDLLHFLDLSTTLQKTYKDLESSKAEGLKIGHFSKTHSLGRCSFCKGSGKEVVAMDFMDDLSNSCEACSGTGFKPEVLTHQLQGHSIEDVLHKSIAQLEELWPTIFSSSKKQLHSASLLFQQLQQAQLGHLTLDRKIKTLSGGEWQRVQLIKGLLSSESKLDGLIVDEAFIGLNRSDQQAMMELYLNLAKMGTYVLLSSNQAFTL